jgi:hypothetical protein
VDVLWPLEAARARSPEHEARWLNLAGFLLRPGFGEANDEVRVNRLFRVLGGDLRHARAVQCRAEWWNLWKRISGGLTARQQQHLLQQVAPALLRRGKTAGPTPEPARAPGDVAGDRKLRASRRRPAAPSSGRCSSTTPCAVRATDQELWALARLGARVPVYGPLNCVVDSRMTATWVTRLLAAEWPRPMRMRSPSPRWRGPPVTGERDLDPELRERLALRLAALPDGARAARIVREPVALEAREEARLLDEALARRSPPARVSASARLPPRAHRGILTRCAQRRGSFQALR